MKTMKNNKLIYIGLMIAAFSAISTGCSNLKDQLKLVNPNSPTEDGNVTTEAGLVALTRGGTYINGFVNQDVWLGDTYFSLVYGFQELLADVVGADAANQNISVINVPMKITSGATVVNNPSPQIPLIRTFNTRAYTGAAYNVTYYQWTNMYTLNMAMNRVLTHIDAIPFTGNADDKKNTFKAWCYFWKGYAYASIGSMYYSGVINNVAGGLSNQYVTQDAIIAESNTWFNLAATTLAAISNTSGGPGTEYYDIMAQLIPSFFQVGHGQVPTGAEWVRNINTLLARNILVNHLAPFVNGNSAATISTSTVTPMTAADWNQVLTLANAGLQSGDNCFTGRSTTINPVFTALGGTVSALTVGPTSSSTFKISERFLQAYHQTAAGDAADDQRLTNNFAIQAAPYTNGTFGTRWELLDGGNGISGTAVLGDLSSGGYELYICGSYEENELMKAEANIQLGNIDTGVGSINTVRNYQGAGIANLGTGLTKNQALAELTRERRVALVFRGLSWYDSRRWGWSYAISNGGGGYNLNYLNGSTLETGATFDYDFLDYWDVPADEVVLNPPAAGGAAPVNPKFN